MEPIHEKIGEKIQRLRKEAGLSQEEFARMLGHTTASSVSYFENGQRRIKVEEIIKIANIFGIDDYHDLLPQNDDLIELTDEAIKFRAKREELKSFNQTQFNEDFKNKAGFRKVTDDL